MHKLYVKGELVLASNNFEKFSNTLRILLKSSWNKEVIVE